MFGKFPHLQFVWLIKCGPLGIKAPGLEEKKVKMSNILFHLVNGATKTRHAVCLSSSSPACGCSIGPLHGQRRVPYMEQSSTCLEQCATICAPHGLSPASRSKGTRRRSGICGGCAHTSPPSPQMEEWPGTPLSVRHCGRGWLRARSAPWPQRRLAASPKQEIGRAHV